MLESHELAQEYLEQFFKHPLSTSLWTAGIVIAIIAVVIYSKWHENKNNKKKVLVIILPKANTIKDKISQAQQEMNNLLKVKDLKSEAVLSLSQKLDKLIVAYLKRS